jgi:hypothetical protein
MILKSHDQILSVHRKDPIGSKSLFEPTLFIRDIWMVIVVAKMSIATLRKALSWQKWASKRLGRDFRNEKALFGS